MPNDKTVLVAGATGGQGGAVARSLIGRGWTVRALVRDPRSAAAANLKALGAELAVGDLDDPASLREAARDVYGVFSVQAADLANPAPETEIRQGVNLADAAVAAGAAHLVYNSVGAAGRGSAVAHFDTKAEIEAHVRRAEVPATVLRPVFFMENWTYLLPQPQDGERIAPLALDPDTTLQMIALDDIGRIVAEVFASPEEFTGETVEIAGDELTVSAIAEALTRADGVPTRFTRLPDADLRAGSEQFANMFAWLNDVGYAADLPALRERHPDLLDFATWLKQQW